MSVTITITDPSESEAMRVIAMLRAHINYAAIPAPVNTPVADALDDVRHTVAQGAADVIVEQAESVFKRDEVAAGFAPPAATIAFAPPPPPPVAAPEGVNSFDPASLDKEGIPWDGRIHMSTKNRTVENVWKRKRNVPDEEYARVVAELRVSQMAPAAPVVVPPPPPAPVALAAPVEAVVPPPPPPAPVAPAATNAATFPEFMAHVTAGVTSQRFTREDITEACVKCGVANLPGLINRPDLIPAVSRELGLIA